MEILAYCLFDGKIDQKSEFEVGLYDDIVGELRLQLFKFGFTVARAHLILIEIMARSKK